MPEAPTFAKFYPLARQGFAPLIQRWRTYASATDERSLMLLADTARIAELGQPPVTLPDAALFAQWSSGERNDPPLWLLKALVFLIVQMPAHPMPESATEQAAWGYLWLRLRPWSSYEEAQRALPLHLHATLNEALPIGWQDMQAQRL